MTIIDWLILAAVAACVILALRHLHRQKGKGCCGDCGSCSGCSACRRQPK
jgi:hypothetical protein